MKTPTFITRASLAATASYPARWFASVLAGTTVLGASAAVAGTWTGTASDDWNNSVGNWSGGNGGTVQVNTVPANVATISANLTTIPTTIIVGNSTTGRVDHRAGNASVAAGNDLVLGRTTAGGNSGNGSYNLADTVSVTGPAGTLTGFRQGSGNLTIPDQVYVGGSLGVATGELKIHTSGALSVGTQLLVGTLGGTGTVTLDSGTVTVADAIEIGNGTGSTGTLRMSNGTITKTVAATAVTIGGGVTTDGGTGTAELNGGTFTVPGVFRVGQDTITASVPVSTGTLKLGGTTLTVNGEFWIGNRNSCTGTLTIDDTAEFRSPRIVLGVQTGATGNLNLNGGIVKTAQITGGAGTEAVTFNGTWIVATGSNAGFIENLAVATIAADGLHVDPAGFSLTASQSMDGTGGVVKTGAGSLRLTGSNSYTGNHTVTAGTLALGSDFTGTGDFTVADGAGMGVVQSFGSSSLTLPNVTLGSSAATTLDLDLGNQSGNPTAPPLVVTGTLALGGTVTVNITDALPTEGSFPLIVYAAPKAGGGSFVLGALPNGVLGNLVDDGLGTVTLEFETVSLPEWSGAQDAIWDIGTENWVDQLTTNPTTYQDPLPVVFDDSATQNTDITLDIDVAPVSVVFDNSSAVYRIDGSGGINGSAALTKTGSANLTLNTDNDYLGATVLSGGTTFVDSLAVGGSLGAATSPIVLSGGGLTYTGIHATTSRGLAINAGGTAISTTNDLTFGGQVTSANGNFVKNGPGKLTFAHNGANVLGTVANSVLVHAGTLALSGAGAQTNSVTGEMWVADQPDTPANLELSNTSLTTTNWLAIGRGNGDDGVTNLTATNSTITTVNFSTGFNGGLPNNASEAFVTLNNTVWTNNGLTYLAESTGSAATMTLNGSSQYHTNNNFLVARFGGTTATVTPAGTSSITKTGGYTAIGNEGTAVLNVAGGAAFTSATGDFNVGDVGTSNGTINLSASGMVNVTNVYIGKNSGTSGTLNQTGGTFQSGNFITIGSASGGTGLVDISAGSLTAGTVLNVGGAGTGTLSVSGSGIVTANGDGVLVGSAAGGFGNLNLNGGTVNAKRVSQATGGNGNVTFNGGLLKAAAGANPTFVGPLATATLLSGGTFIDTNGQSLAIPANLTGSGGLTKSGAGTLTLAGANTYSGHTTVSAGTLSATTAFFANTSTVSIAAGAVLNLPHGTTDLVGGLTLGVTPLAAGTYDSATHPGVITGSGSPSPSATHEGFTYTIQGGTTLGAFTTAATVVNPVTAGLPAVPSGYEYRTFSLAGSNGTSATGFLRVNLTP